MSYTENLGRCPQCKQFLIAEEQKTHKCNFSDIPILDCEELVLDHITDSGQDRNGDHVHLAWALNGTLYRLLVCKHTPPHSAKRKFTPEDTKHEGNSTQNVVNMNSEREQKYENCHRYYEYHRCP